MAYRDRPPACPRCGVDLLRRQRRDIWRCSRCAGTLLAAAEVERRLRLVAPDITEDVIRDVMTARRSRTVGLTRPAETSCPLCRRAMRPVAMGGVRVARCDTDDQIWFDGRGTPTGSDAEGRRGSIDASDLERVLARAGARHESQRSWWGRLFSHLFAS